MRSKEELQQIFDTVKDNILDVLIKECQRHNLMASEVLSILLSITVRYAVASQCKHDTLASNVRKIYDLYTMFNKIKSNTVN